MKNDLIVAKGKVRTILQSGKIMEIMNELDIYNTDTAALREIRWNGQGRMDKKSSCQTYMAPVKRRII